MGTDFAPLSALWLRADGSYIRGRAGWTMEFGLWHSSIDAILLRPTVHLRGDGGQEGFETETIEAHGADPTCAAQRAAPTFVRVAVEPCAATSEAATCSRFDGEPLLRVASNTQMDEAFYRRGCTGPWRPPQ